MHFEDEKRQKILDEFRKNELEIKRVSDILLKIIPMLEFDKDRDVIVREIKKYDVIVNFLEEQLTDEISGDVSRQILDLLRDFCTPYLNYGLNEIVVVEFISLLCSKSNISQFLCKWTINGFLDDCLKHTVLWNNVINVLKAAKIDDEDISGNEYYFCKAAILEIIKVEQDEIVKLNLDFND